MSIIHMKYEHDFWFFFFFSSVWSTISSRKYHLTHLVNVWVKWVVLTWTEQSYFDCSVLTGEISRCFSLFPNNYAKRSEHSVRTAWDQRLCLLFERKRREPLQNPAAAVLFPYCWWSMAWIQLCVGESSLMPDRGDAVTSARRRAGFLHNSSTL